MNAHIAAVVVTLLSAGCSGGETCGFGRCFDGSECVSVFGPPRVGNDDFNFPRRPESPYAAANEFWCKRECPSSSMCPSAMCLEDPADSEHVVCEAPDVQITYIFNGTMAYSDRFGQTRCVRASEYTVGNVSCMAGTPCEFGRVAAGGALPAALVLVFAGDLLPFPDYFSSRFEDQLGADLPADTVVQISANSAPCP